MGLYYWEQAENVFVGKIIDFPQTRGPAQPKIRNKNTSLKLIFTKGDALRAKMEVHL